MPSRHPEVPVPSAIFARGCDPKNHGRHPERNGGGSAHPGKSPGFDPRVLARLVPAHVRGKGSGCEAEPGDAREASLSRDSTRASRIQFYPSQHSISLSSRTFGSSGSSPL